MSSFALNKRGLNSARRSLSVLFLFLLIGLISSKQLHNYRNA